VSQRCAVSPANFACRLIQADGRLVRLRTYASDIVAAKATDDPVGPTADRRHEAAEGYCRGIAGDRGVYEAHSVARSSLVEQVAHDLKPRLQVVGEAVAQGEHRLPGPSTLLRSDCHRNVVVQADPLLVPREGLVLQVARAALADVLLLVEHESERAD
jgi:hypothetical protein